MIWLPKFLRRDKPPVQIELPEPEKAQPKRRRAPRKRLPQARDIAQYDAGVSAWLRAGRQGLRPRRQP